MGMSRETAAAVLDDVLLRDNLYLALFSGDPAGEGGGTELSGGGYERQPAAFSEAAWNEDLGGVESHNTEAVSFGTVTESQDAEIAYWAVISAGGTDTMLWSGAFGQPCAASAGDTVVIPAGSLHCVIR